MNGPVARQRNCELILAVMNLPQASRRELAERLGWSVPSVSRQVEELCAAGLLEETGKLESAGRVGPRLRVLAVRGEVGASLGVDLEGLAVRAVVLDFANQVRAVCRVDLQPGKGVEGVIRAARNAVRAVLEKAAWPAERLVGLGLGLPGYGPVAENSAPIWQHFAGFEQLADENGLAEEFGLPLIRRPNVVCFALAESRLSQGVHSPSLAVVLARFGVGCALVRSGQVLDFGRGGNKFGHMVIRAGGRPCCCGRRGCLEAYAGGWALARRLSGAEESLAPYQQFQRAGEEPGSEARAALRAGCRQLGLGLANLTALVAPDDIVLHGLYNLLGEDELAELQAAVAAVAPDQPAPRVRFSQLDEYAGALGAAMAARDEKAPAYLLQTYLPTEARNPNARPEPV